MAAESSSVKIPDSMTDMERDEIDASDTKMKDRHRPPISDKTRKEKKDWIQALQLTFWRAIVSQITC